MKGIKCSVVVNTANGHCCQPKECNSVKEAVEYAKGFGFAYMIFDKSGKLIKRGFC